MKPYVIWLVLLHLCCCEVVDYSDFYPDTIPFRSEHPSPQYKVVMDNLCNNWHSPISYLKKRGYMPINDDYQRTKIYHRNPDKGENYFFFPENKQPVARNNKLMLENDQSGEAVTQPSSPPPQIDETTKNETAGIISKVKDKFLSIFSHKDKPKSDQTEEGPLDLEYSEFLENYNDYNEFADRKLFVRSVSEKPAKYFNTSNEGILSNLTDVEIHFIKSFINWFKLNKEDFKFLSSLNKTTLGKSPEQKPGNLETSKQNEMKNSTESGDDKNLLSSTMKPQNTSTECMPSSVTKPNQEKKTETHAKNSSSSSNPANSDEKDDFNDFTVDLDINQKNGTGEEILLQANCTCVESSIPTPTSTLQSPNPLLSDKQKYVITKSKFLAHLHHMVDEVGKPPHKHLDLTKVQDIIDNYKKLHTVTMGGGKTTECTPLRLNDMSFDLEWNKMNEVAKSDLDIPYANKPEVQSLAAKFLQDVNSYPEKNDEYLKTPYADNFLDSQQSLPSDLDLPFKISSKREVGLPRFFDTYYDDEDAEESPKRRIKGRIKGRRKNKKPKYKRPTNKPPQTADLNVVEDEVQAKEATDFNSFDELRDIQFRVNEDDEQAISNFISSLNSPPEVFSFDVDKYLRSAKQDMEPKITELEYQSPEQRTYYEFLESPSVENERLPLLESPSDDTIIDKRSRANNKRDLLRQYIKGVSNALSDNSFVPSHRDSEEKTQRSPNFDTDIQYRTNNLIDRFSTNLDATDSIKSESEDPADDSLNNYFLLNDGSAQVFDDKPIKLNAEENPADYSPQSLEIDLDLNRKFQDLNIERYGHDLSRSLGSSVDLKSINSVPQGEMEESSHVESTNDQEF